MKATANYRKAQLSYSKAELHVIREKAFQGIPYRKKESVESKMELWKNKTHEEIINYINQDLSKITKLI